MRAQKRFLVAAAVVALTVVAHTALADAYTYDWTGAEPENGVYNWLTADNWKSSDGGTATPDNEDTAVFSKLEDYTVTVNVSANGTQFVQAIYVSKGAGALTIRTGQGWWSTRTLQFRKDTNNPSITNFINKSSNPVTFFGANDSNLRITVGNAWGQCKFGPGAIYDLPFSVPDTKVWFVGQAEPRTDNVEMNKSVFKKTAEVCDADIGLNHWVEVSGTFTVTNTLAVTGKLILNGGTMSCLTITQAEGGEVEVKGVVTLTADSVSGNVFTFTPAFSMIGYDLTSDTTLKIAKSGLAAAPTSANFKIGSFSGLALKDGVSADDAFSFEIDDTTDPDYYIVTPKLVSITYLGTIPLTASYVADDDGNMTNATRVVLAKSLFDGAPTAADFELSGVSGVTPAVKPLLAVSVGEEGDNYVVTVTPAMFVTSTPGTHAWTNPEAWNDGGAAQSGKHYLIAQGRIDSTDAIDESNTFPGDSLTVCSGGIFSMKGITHVVNNLYLGENAQVVFNNQNTAKNRGQFLEGNIYVGGDTAASPAKIGGTETYTYRLNSTISGEGQLQVGSWYRGWGEPTFNPTVEVNGDNSGFMGKLTVKSDYATLPAIVVFSSATAFGGNFETELTDGVKLDNATLLITNDLTFTALNRGFQFVNTPTIEVGEDKTFTISSKVSFDSAAFAKTGAGTLVFAGDNSAANKTITVSEGSIVAASAKAAGRMAVSAAEGASASLPSVELTDAEVAARKIVDKDWLFVPDGSASDTADENLARMTGRGWSVPDNYGLAKWRTTLGQYAVDGGVMLTVSGKLPGYAVMIR